jgi:hypothetical protein
MALIRPRPDASNFSDVDFAAVVAATPISNLGAQIDTLKTGVLG